MTEVEEELQKATMTVPTPTFDELMAKAKEADDEKSQAYRAHIQKLIDNDFIYVTFVVASSRLEVTAKRDGLKDVSALILQIIKESVLQNKEEEYHSGKNGGITGYV